jgi:hypothetical protein
MAKVQGKPDVLYGTGQFVIERDASAAIEVTFLPPWFRCRGEPDRTASVRFEPGDEADAFERQLDKALAADQSAGIYRVEVTTLLAGHVPDAMLGGEPAAPSF